MSNPAAFSKHANHFFYELDYISGKLAAAIVEAVGGGEAFIKYHDTFDFYGCNAHASFFSDNKALAFFDEHETDIKNAIEGLAQLNDFDTTAEYINYLRLDEAAGASDGFDISDIIAVLDNQPNDTEKSNTGRIQVGKWMIGICMGHLGAQYQDYSLEIALVTYNA